MTETKPMASAAADERLVLPEGAEEGIVRAGRRNVRVTNLTKVFFPESGITKGELIQYYSDIAPILIPHLRDRAMVMKRYPNGIEEEHFFMKRTPSGAPPWVECCSIRHGSGNVIDFPMTQDRATLLWLINLGCVDLNPWYSRCDDINRPDFLNFDLDPVPPADFGTVREAALAVRETLEAVGAPTWVKTSGSKGVHIYVPIERDLKQKQVWSYAKRIANELAEAHPDLITAEYRIANRPPGRVLVDYNQNAWGRTLASVYSVRPRPGAPVSAPVTWQEVESGIEILDFTLRNLRERLDAVGDLWRKLLWQRGRFDLKGQL